LIFFFLSRFFSGSPSIYATSSSHLHHFNFFPHLRRPKWFTRRLRHSLIAVGIGISFPPQPHIDVSHDCDIFSDAFPSLNAIALQIGQPNIPSCFMIGASNPTSTTFYNQPSKFLPLRLRPGRTLPPSLTHPPLRSPSPLHPARLVMLRPPSTPLSTTPDVMVALPLIPRRRPLHARRRPRIRRRVS